MDWDRQYSINKANITHSSGKLDLKLTAKPIGFDLGNKEKLILAEFSCDLNENNAPFDFHSFLDVDGKIKDSYHLEWLISANSIMKFGKI